MALVLKDRVLETCTSPGTGTVTLLGAVTGYQSFSTVGNGNTCYYAIADQSGANWEVGIGTYSSGTLARTTVLSSSNGGNLTNFSTGSQNVFLTYPSERSVNLSSAALTSGRVSFATTDGLLTDSANLTFDGTTFTASSIKNSALTSGRVTYAGASGLLTDSANFIWDNTNARLGIGTSPSFKLHISTTGNVTSQAYNVNTDTGAGVYVGYIASTDKNETALRSYGSGFTTFTHAGISLANFTELWAGVASSTGPAGMLLGVESASPVIFATNNTEKMRITSAGNVGIGTTTATRRLQVGSGAGDQKTAIGQSLICLAANSGNLGYVNEVGFGGNGSTNVQCAIGSIVTSATSTGYADLYFATRSVTTDTAPTEKMRIDSSGNVGIGTSSPAFLTEIVGGATTVETTLLQIRSNAGGIGTGSTIAFANSTSAAAGSGRVELAGIRDTASGSSFVIRTADSSGTIQNRVKINESGNVGIGTSSPNRLLSLYATQPVFQITNVASGNTQGTIQYQESGATNFILDNQGSGSGGAIIFQQAGTERARINTSGNVGIGTSSPSAALSVIASPMVNQLLIGASTADSGYGSISFNGTSGATRIGFTGGGTGDPNLYYDAATSGIHQFRVNNAIKMVLDSSGNLLVGKTVNDTTTNGCNISAAGRGSFSSNGQAVGDYNRTGDDGVLVNFLQDGTIEGTISVSGTTVSYNGGHLSRWSQWQNQSGQPNVYRGTVLESTNDMCQWNQANEQSTKTIVSNTEKAKTVAGVFDMYDFDDKANPNDFYVAQSGDFVIRIAQGVVVQNGDLLESAGDGTARPQTDDICRSSTIAKVTSNYVSTTYADGSFCVPCILMIG